MFSRRSDADLARDVAPYRKIMPILMRGRNESAVYFEQELDLSRTEPFLASFNEGRPERRATLMHLVVWAIVQTLHARPRLNRFVAGGKIWYRRGIWISYSAKKRIDDASPIVVIKRRFDPEESFAALVDGMHGGLKEGRSDQPSSTDKELGIITRLPVPLMRLVVGLGRWADAWGLLPRWFIDGDPMFASAFIANLGSLKMDAAYHHLFEYGNIPIFCVIGRKHDRVAVKDGSVTSRPSVLLRYTYDERVEDGLYAQRALEKLREMVEDPASFIE